MKRSALLTGLLLSLVLLFSCLAVSCGWAGNGGGDSSSSVSTELPEPEGFKINVAEYTIVRPLKPSSSTLAAAVDLKKQIDRLTGDDIKISDDWVSDVSQIPGDAREILVGVTNRNDSKTSLNVIEGTKFSIRISGNRIIITASNDTLLEAAVRHFIDTYVSPTARAGRFYLPENLNFISDEYPTISLVSSGVTQYSIIYPGGANDAAKSEYITLGETFKKLTGTAIIVGTDILSKAGSYDSKSYEILLGDTGHPETAEAMGMLKPDEYGIFSIGNKIVVCGRTRASSVLAVRKFISLLESSAIKGEDGKVSINLVYSKPLIYKNSEYSMDIPEFSAGVLDGAYDCGEGVLGMYYTCVKQTDFEKYCALVEAEGFIMTYSHTASKNTFKTYTDGDTRFYITYSQSDYVRIITEDASMPEAPVTAETYSVVCTPSVTQLALSYTADNTNGMGYIVRLSDGSFIIYDGGFTADSETVMSALKRLNVTGDKPHIRMWLLTHMHGDHYQAFIKFSSDYAKEVNLDYLAHNVAHPLYDVDYPTVYTKGSINTALSRFTGTKHLKLHAGSVLRFADAEIEILLTQEELYPSLLSLTYTNDTSVVSRLKLGGQTVLFPGDMQTLGSDVLVAIYGNYLKSDIVQIAHHGSIKHSATREFYEHVAPKWAFFPGSLSRYNTNSSSDVNRYLIREAGIKQIFVADNGDRTLNLPF